MPFIFEGSIFVRHFLGCMNNFQAFPFANSRLFVPFETNAGGNLCVGHFRLPILLLIVTNTDGNFLFIFLGFFFRAEIQTHEQSFFTAQTFNWMRASEYFQVIVANMSWIYTHPLHSMAYQQQIFPEIRNQQANSVVNVCIGGVGYACRHFHPSFIIFFSYLHLSPGIQFPIFSYFFHCF